MQSSCCGSRINTLRCTISNGKLLSLIVSRDWWMRASVAAPNRTVAQTDGAVMHEGGGTYIAQPEERLKDRYCRKFRVMENSRRIFTLHLISSRTLTHSKFGGTREWGFQIWRLASKILFCIALAAGCGYDKSPISRCWFLISQNPGITLLYFGYKVIIPS